MMKNKKTTENAARNSKNWISEEVAGDFSQFVFGGNLDRYFGPVCTLCTVSTFRHVPHAEL
jgi:hypothetical protein